MFNSKGSILFIYIVIVCLLIGDVLSCGADAVGISSRGVAHEDSQAPQNVSKYSDFGRLVI